jgi:hypothetical protein
MAKGALTKLYDLKKSDQSNLKRNRIKSLSVLHKPDSAGYRSTQYTSQELKRL